MINKITLSILGMLFAFVMLPFLSKGQCPDGLSATPSVITPITCNGAATGVAVAGPAGGRSPYTYSWSAGGGSNDTINSYSIASAETFSYEASIQTFTIPAGITQISVTLSGGAGGDGNSTSSVGGNGAGFIGVATVTPGHVLGIVTGGQGQSGIIEHGGGGGGGGSYVWDENTTTLLAVAAGGGGAGYSATGGGAGGTDLTTNATTTGASGIDGAGGTGGNGGTGASAAAGAGWYSNGGNGNWTGGSDMANGFTGGAGAAANGGFGGGGGGAGSAGGGGGGYNGGGGGSGVPPGGGGGSYFNTAYGSLPTNVTATNAGNGSVSISYLIASPDGLVAGTYTVNVTDNNGCTTTASVTLTQPNSLRDSIVTASIVNVTCNAGTDGSATLGVQHGTAPYTYSWNNGSTEATASNLSAGTYTVTLEDNCGVPDTASVIITQPNALSITASVNSSNACSGVGEGNAQVIPSDGTSPYTYSWSTGATTASTGSVLSAGTYSVSVQDNCGTSVSMTVIMPSSALRDSIVAASIVNITCNGASTGSAEVGMKGGAVPYIYLWSTGGGTDATIAGLTAGTYSVNVTDANGCIVTASVNITQPSPLRDSVASTVNVLCSGTSTGSVTLGVQYGTAPYTYSWSSGSTNATASNLSAGTYIVTVEDNCGVSGTASVIITQPGALSITASVNSPNACTGGGTGNAAVIAFGGGSPYTYSWSTGATTSATGSVLSAGTYTVNVQDNCGASVSMTVIMPSSALRDSIVASATVNNTCNGASAGSAEVGVKGGAVPYTYLWSTGGGTNAIINSYSVVASQTFSYTGVIQNFSIPVGISQVTISVTGAAGAAGSGTPGGNGASFAAVVPVTSGHILSVVVGGEGLNDGATGGGGGASWVYDSTVAGVHTGTPSLSALIAVAAGGGGGSYNNTSGGGAGGIDLVGDSTTNGGNTNSPGGTGGNGGVGGNDDSFNPDDCGGAGGGGWLSNATGIADGTNGNDWANSFASAPGGDGNDGGYGGGGGGSGCAAGGGGGYNGGGGGVAGVGGGDGGGGGSYLNGTVVGGALTDNGTGNGIVSISYSDVHPSGLMAGTYSVTVTDNNGCIATAQVTITQPNALRDSISSITQICTGGGDNGSATLGVKYGTPPYTYSWSSGGGSSATVSGLTAGTYTITLQDNCEATVMVAITISQPNALTVTASITSSNICRGGSDGSATAYPAGGNIPYTYSWSDGITTSATGTVLSAGAYTVTVYDNCGSSATAMVVMPGSALRDSIVTASIVDVACNGGSNGSAMVGVKGGASPFAYLWTSGGGTNATINSYSISNTLTYSYAGLVQNFVVPGGITQITVSIAGAQGGSWYDDGGYGASFIGVCTVTPGHIISIAVGGQGGSSDESDGSAGGGGTFVYDSTTATLFAVGAGGGGDDWVGDGGGNAGSDLIANTTTNGPGSVNTAAGGSGGNGGSGGLDGEGPGGGGAGWLSNGGNGADGGNGIAGGGMDRINNFAGGAYPGGDGSESGGFGGGGAGAYASGGGGGGYNGGGGGNDDADADGNGGGGGGSYLNGGTANLIGSVTANNTGNGFVTISYSASNPSGLAAGTYSVTVTDNNGCSATAGVNITQPAAIAPIATTTANVSCSGGSNGQAKVSATGGTAPYTYSWSPNNSSTYIANGLSAGTYTVTLTDHNGCTSTAAAAVTQPTALTDSVAVVNYPQCGGETASATIGVQGGTSPYRYIWSPNVSTAATASGLTMRAYVVQVKDANSCFKNVNFSISQPPVPVLRDSIVKSATLNVSCNGGSNGSATVGVKYGTSPYTYSWSSGGGNSATAIGLSAGTYTVTVNDAASCMATAAVTIVQANPLASATATTSANISCHGGSNGQAKVSVLGGTSPYIYSWSPVSSSAYIANGLSAGTYTVTVSDNCGASVSSSATVTQPAVLFDSLASITYPPCTGTTGSATIGVRGGTSPYRYTWSPNVSTTASAAGLSVRAYVVQVKDNNGCYNNLNFSISQPPSLRDSIIKSATVNVSCNGGGNGSATVGAKYGSTPYTYTWSPAGGSNASAEGLSAGTYTVTVSDGSCSTTASVVITQPGTLLPAASVSNGITCYGTSTGKAKVTVSGGSSPYTYSWSPVSSSASTATGLSVGTYTVTVSDKCGNSASSSAMVTQPVVLFDSIASLTHPLCGTATGKATIGVTGGTSPYRYTWSPNVSTTDSASGLSARNYVVQVKDANSCYNDLTVSVTCSQPVTATYKEEASIPVADNINLYPNPTTGQFTLSGLQTGMILEMYDYTGKKISSTTTTNETMQLNINEANGVYLIRILDKDGNLVSEKKVVKMQ